MFCSWQPLGRWDQTTDLEDFIETELMRIEKENMTVAGVTKLSNRPVPMESERDISQAGIRVGVKCYSL